MKKSLFTQGILSLLVCMVTLFSVQNLNAQCTMTALYPAGTVLASDALTNINTCNYLGEYSNISGIEAGESYEFTADGVNGYITIYQDGAVLGHGQSPLTVVAASASDVEGHWTVDAACTTASSCVLTTVQCTTCMATPPPANDDICGAMMAADGAPASGEINAVTTASDISPTADPACASYSGADVWFSIVVPATGGFTVEGINPVGFTDGGATLYSSSDNTCSGTLTEIVCDDDGGVGTQPLITVTGQNPGDVLFFRYWEYAGGSFGTFDVQVTNEAPPCDTPTGVSHSLVDPARCDISWDAMPNALRYDVHYRVKGSGPAGWVRTGALSNSKSLHYLMPNTEYDYIVRSTCDGTWDFAQATAIRRFNTANLPGAATREMFTADEMTVFPNPARENILISYGVKEVSDVNISITDMTGKVIFQRASTNVEGFQNETVDVSGFAQGFYIISVQSGDDVMVKKFATIK